MTKLRNVKMKLMETPIENQGIEDPEIRQERIVSEAKKFADILSQDIGPILDKLTNIKTCRTLTVASAKLLDSIGHHPVIRVKVGREHAGVYHYWLEDPELGVAIDFSPMSHTRSFMEESFNAPRDLLRLLATNRLVLPINSVGYQMILNVGQVEIRDKGQTIVEMGQQQRHTWNHIHLDRTPDSIKNQLEILKSLSV